MAASLYHSGYRCTAEQLSRLERFYQKHTVVENKLGRKLSMRILGALYQLTAWVKPLTGQIEDRSPYRRVNIVIPTTLFTNNVLIFLNISVSVPEVIS